MNADKYRTAASSKDFSAPLLLRGACVIFASLLCLSLLKYFWLAGHAHPVADDFCYAAKSRGASLWAWSFSEWMNWNGRYASNLLMIHGPLTWSSDLLPGYRMVPVLLILSTFLSFWFFLRRAMEHALTTGQEMGGALAFLLLYLNLMPDLGEGFYWYTGAVTYQLGSILMLVHLGLLFRREQEGRQGWRRALVLLLNIVLAVVITGMDEIHMLLMVALHAGRFVWLVRKRSSHVAGLLLLGVVGAGAALMYLAPGNAVRGGMFADTHLFWRSLGMSALQAVRFVGTWVLSPALLAFSVLYIPVGGVGTIVLDQASSILLTLALTVSIVNAMNFVDGLDGLAAGLGLITALAICMFSVGLLRETQWKARLEPTKGSKENAVRRITAFTRHGGRSHIRPQHT